MTTASGIGLTTVQKTQMSQTQIQSLEILSMDRDELGALLQNEYIENPMMDCKDSSSFSGADNIESHYEHTVSYGKTYDEIVEEEDQRRRDMPSPDADAVKDFLLFQLPIREYEHVWPLMEYMTDCLDEYGYFSDSLSDVAEKTGYSEEMVKSTLSVLKTLEPCGIFAKDLSECLLLQLAADGKEDGNAAKIIRSGHLEDIAAGKISRISRSLGLTTAEVRLAIEDISLLKPRPLSGIGSGKSHYIVPDILLSRNGGEWTAELNDDWVENYRVNDYYLHMMAEVQDEELKEYFRTRLERVRFLLASIASRRRTILSIASAAAAIQSDYLSGEGPLRPLAMNEIADQLSVHPSTVSRAVRGKTIQYPGGTIPFRALFRAAALKSSETAIDSGSVKDRIRDLIAGENTKKPLSDEALSKILKGEGIRISRRTVAAYREEMNIPSSFNRKA